MHPLIQAVLMVHSVFACFGFFETPLSGQHMWESRALPTVVKASQLFHCNAAEAVLQA